MLLITSKVFDINEHIKRYNKRLIEKLNYGFIELNLLKTSLTHSSIKNEYNNIFETDNEKFEFLGDSILDLIVSKFLCLEYGFNLSEGDMTVYRSKIVKESSLAYMARIIDMDEYILFSNSIDRNSNKTMNSLLSNSFEALVAAIMLDSSYEKVEEVILKKYRDVFYHFIDSKSHDYKSEINIWTTTRFNTVPKYETNKVTHDVNCSNYKSIVKINNEIWGEGKGSSKKESEQEAARTALKKLEKSKNE